MCLILGHEDLVDGEFSFFNNSAWLVVHFGIYDGYDNKRIHLGMRGTGHCGATVNAASKFSGARKESRENV